LGRMSLINPAKVDAFLANIAVKFINNF
jgi:hypothetical protein